MFLSYSHHVGLDYQTTLEHMSSSDNFESTTTHKMTLLGLGQIITIHGKITNLVKF